MSRSGTFERLFPALNALPNARLREVYEMVGLLGGEDGPAWAAYLKRIRVAGLPDQPPKAPALQVPKTKLIVDLNADPFVPGGWSVKVHQMGGLFEFKPSKVKNVCWWSQNADGFETRTLRKGVETAKRMPFNACLLDFYLANPRHIPEEWKARLVCFPGTVYRSDRGVLRIRYLCWNDRSQSWGWNWRELEDWSGGYVAAVHAT